MNSNLPNETVIIVKTSLYLPSLMVNMGRVCVRVSVRVLGGRAGVNQPQLSTYKHFVILTSQMPKVYSLVSG